MHSTSQWICRSTDTPECKDKVSKTEKCERCGKLCQEELTSGEKVMRCEIPEYVLKDINGIEQENTQLMNSWMQGSERFFMAFSVLMKNLDRRGQLQIKMKNTIEGGLRKARLHKDKLVKWGYDPYKKTFVGVIQKAKDKEEE